MKAYHKNPRQITPHQLEQLEQWLGELGDLGGIVHDLNSDEVVGGNQRARVFDINQCETVLTEGPHEPDEQGTVALGYVVWQDKRYGYRQVRWTPEWCEKANIVANKAGGEWDLDALVNEFEVGDLLEWGFDEQSLQIGWEDDTYTRKIEPPEYTPQGPAPELAMLYNDSKTVALIEEMDACDVISDEEREFLRIAAQRHTVLDFQCIANYYAHASPEMQELMENNALVIIDFNKAISQGFVELSTEIADMVRDEYGNE